MAAADDFSTPSYVIDWLKGLGYGAYTTMQADISTWWSWFTARSTWYDQVGWDSVNRKKVRYRKYSLRPARRVCREWASLMFADGTEASADNEESNRWLGQWMRSERLLVTAQMCTERAFALGTGALALWFDLPADASRPGRMRVRRYDARMILPLSWDETDVTECAFVTNVSARGQRLTQASAHVIGENGTYEVRTALFDSSGSRVSVGGVLESLDTRQPLPTFCIIRPAIDNVVADCSPMGQSVYEDAVDAIKAVDDSFDSLVRELMVTKPKVFMDDQLLRVTDESGRRVPVPMAPEETVIRSVTGSGGDDLIKTFQPDIRTDALRSALDTALAELGDLTGFGQQYLTLDKAGGVKTATEVSADSSALMRNLRKHEEAAGAGLGKMLEAALMCAGKLLGADLPDGQTVVDVSWDDSIIEDTPAEKAQMQSEIAAGIAAPWEYRRRFYGESEEEARRMADEASGGSPVPDDSTGAFLPPDIARGEALVAQPEEV